MTPPAYEVLMHHHHSRALRIARRNYNFCRGVVARRIEEEQRFRSMYLARLDRPESVKAAYLDYYKKSLANLEKALVELQNQLSVVMTVERMLEKA